ncbi:DUF3369 domain-containing protein [Alteromonas sediminis]|uniref:DUF3369 domain-containing protein n=1 Tax=Alteromonas sediminis TaxID=2259342 RepID=A0A3N5XYP5_9ALTE|nr:response regulator [Alteromonas sediminis]RPJ65086.1 DUF3369 domain-containing protein [Alteromonas sediminis]
MNLVFLDEDTPNEEPAESWAVLVVDDEPEVHTVTNLALGSLRFQGKGLELISAFSGQQAREILQNRGDIAAVLLDVVMETEDEGLKVADFIRNQIHNKVTRIVLRTGQPGLAPEKDVIINYDINDYKSKTELTVDKLFTAMYTALRSYSDLVTIEASRQGLEKVIQASADLFCIRTLETFIKSVVQQLKLLSGESMGDGYTTTAIACPRPMHLDQADEFFVFTGDGNYSHKTTSLLSETIQNSHITLCQRAIDSQSLVHQQSLIAAYWKSGASGGSLLFLSELTHQPNDVEFRLFQILTQNVQIAFENVLLTRVVEDTQREIVERLGLAIEKQYGTGRHIQRMVTLCEFLAIKSGMTDRDIELLKLAIPLHDIGNSRIPYAIVSKLGRLTPEEADIVKVHAERGYNLLKDSSRPTIKMAALLAKEHYEHWDGGGYPHGLKGEEISLASRISTLVDVYDAQRNMRARDALITKEKVISLFQQQQGRQFDPDLVTLLMDNFDSFERVMTEFTDSA